MLTVALTLSGCVEDPVPPVEFNEFQIGEVFNINFNECVTLVDSVDNETYTLCFNGPVNDGRTPTQDCYLSLPGAAYIGIAWIGQDQDPTNIVLKIYGCNDGYDDCPGNIADTLNYGFCLLKLDPYPDTAWINQNDYVAKLKVIGL